MFVTNSRILYFHGRVGLLQERVDVAIGVVEGGVVDGVHDDVHQLGIRLAGRRRPYVPCRDTTHIGRSESQ